MAGPLYAGASAQHHPNRPPEGMGTLGPPGGEHPVGVLMTRLDFLEKALHQLESRLEGVLLPAHPVPEGGGAETRPAQSRSPVAQHLMDIASRINTLTSYVGVLTSRVEL